MLRVFLPGFMAWISNWAAWSWLSTQGRGGGGVGSAAGFPKKGKEELFMGFIQQSRGDLSSGERLQQPRYWSSAVGQGPSVAASGTQMLKKKGEKGKCERAEPHAR